MPKSLHAVDMISAAMVNTQTHTHRNTHRQTGFDPAKLQVQPAELKQSIFAHKKN